MAISTRYPSTLARVYKITPTGQIRTIADLPDITNGYIGPVFDAFSGNLFVSKVANGSGSQVLKITPAGVVSLFATVPVPSGLAADGQGNLFVGSYKCPSGAVYKITAAGVASIFGTGLCGPDGVAIGPNGDLYVGARGSQQIMRVPAAGGVATVYAQGISNPVAVAVDQTGQVFAADFDNGTIYAIGANGSLSPIASGLYSPDGLVFDQQNQLYIADLYTNQVVKLTTPPSNIEVVANVQRPREITVDTSGNLYTIGHESGTINKIAPSGQVTTIADLPDLTNGYTGPAFDPVSGNLFVSRYANGSGNQVLKITPAGVVSTFATLASPGGLTADGQGNLFVLKYTLSGGVLYKITAAGVVSTFGTGLCHSDDVAVGPNGDLFINDRGTQRIMRVPATGGAASVYATGIGLVLWPGVRQHWPAIRCKL